MGKLIGALLAVLLAGCSSSPPQQTATSTTTRMPAVDERVIVIDESTSWRLEIIQEGSCSARSDEARLDIRNNLDRNLTLDFDGPSHYEVSIGDRKDYVLQVQPGSYKVRASSPGLSHVPRDETSAFGGGACYVLAWYGGKDPKKYREQ